MSVATRTLSYLPEGTALSRYMMAKAISRGDAFRAQMIAERWRDSPQLKACLGDEPLGVVGNENPCTAQRTGSWDQPGVAVDAADVISGP